ncbi:MAG: NAD+ synthase [Flavobacteriales bacterium]|nr:NAD+ synthase [Flavobacteriales bacterium]MCX7767410.1 NAD+ synthase [Flavobacteriales bacterium]MDW8410174.1 NAD+ synthase [Flavobacteriales bacterium]
MKVALGQINTVIGHFEHNVARIKSFIDQAEREKADLVVFPELSICGYPPQDFLEFSEFIEACQKAVDKVAQYKPHLPVIVGAPIPNPGAPGKNLLNGALWLQDGSVRHYTVKALLPNYDVFDEYRYFEGGRQFSVIEFKGVRFGLTICEDVWDISEDPEYTVSPPKELARYQPHVLINISASPFNAHHHEARLQVMRHWCTRLKLTGLYCNCAGAQTELIFDGGSFALNAEGQRIAQAPFFQEALLCVDLNGPAIPNLEDPSVLERIHQAIILGIRDYFHKQGFRKAILGLSGGIDSSLVAVLAAEALGPQNVLALLMPSEFSSSHSLRDGEALARNLGIEWDVLPIQPIFDTYLKNLSKHFSNTPFNVAEENLQSRIRANLLMAISNKYGHVLLNTSNKSELAVGYGTLYGDMCGALSVIGDLYKTQVYQLAHHIQATTSVFPPYVLTKEPSAELRPNQKDTDSLPPYEVLDAILQPYIEERKGPRRICQETGFSPDLVVQVLRMVNRAEFKRRQSPPVLRVSVKAFGPGRRLPVVGRYLE